MSHPELLKKFGMAHTIPSYQEHTILSRKKKNSSFMTDAGDRAQAYDHLLIDNEHWDGDEQGPQQTGAGVLLLTATASVRQMLGGVRSPQKWLRETGAPCDISAPGLASTVEEDEPPCLPGV